jgi:metallo-beta-lactamase class B
MRGSGARVACALAIALGLLGSALAGCARKPGVPLEMLTWDRDFPPHRVAGNVYFVGRKNVGIFLITSPEGHILLDSGFEASVPAVQASVEQLGFRFQDIKYLLASHAHIDHVQGHARVRQLTGARVLASERDAPFIRSGGQDDPAFGNRYRWAPCPVDQIVRDGDTVAIGGTVLTARLTPGHTPGATTWTMRVNDGGKTLQVVFFPSAIVLPGSRLVGNDAYPSIAADFAGSFATWKALPCDVFLGAHGAFYKLDRKYPRLAQAGGGNPFIDPEGFRQTIGEMESSFRAQLESQQ